MLVRSAVIVLPLLLNHVYSVSKEVVPSLEATKVTSKVPPQPAEIVVVALAPFQTSKEGADYLG